jgi:UrcA family protein
MLQYRFNRTAALLSAGLIVAAISFAAIAASAAEANSIDVRSINVRTGDLDLASASGRAVLDERVIHAVDRICGSAHARSTWEQQNYADCSKAARAEAAPRIDAMVAAAQNARKVAGVPANNVPVR